MDICVRNGPHHSATQHVIKYQEGVQVKGKKVNQLLCYHNMSKTRKMTLYISNISKYDNPILKAHSMQMFIPE